MRKLTNAFYTLMLIFDKGAIKILERFQVLCAAICMVISGVLFLECTHDDRRLMAICLIIFGAVMGLGLVVDVVVWVRKRGK